VLISLAHSIWPILPRFILRWIAALLKQAARSVHVVTIED
jgi:hypothetical protein